MWNVLEPNYQCGDDLLLEEESLPNWPVGDFYCKPLHLGGSLLHSIIVVIAD